jgi:opacity protein-like surface antigen
MKVLLASSLLLAAAAAAAAQEPDLSAFEFASSFDAGSLDDTWVKSSSDKYAGQNVAIKSSKVEGFENDT